MDRFAPKLAVVNPDGHFGRSQLLRPLHSGEDARTFEK